MKTIRIGFCLVAGTLTLAALLCLPSSSRGATIILNVDPSRSSLTLTGGLSISGSWPYSPQVTGAMVDSFGGQIVVNNLGGGVVSFTGGSSIQALLNPNSISPGFRPNNAGGDPFGAPWSGKDNYGAQSLPFGVAWYDAYRDLTLDIISGTASSAGVPASAMYLGFTSGKNDMSGPGFGLGLTQPVSGWPISSRLNGSAGNVTWDGTTLTVPVVLVTESWNANGLLIDETWTGQFVAVIPEPSSLALAGLVLVVLAARRIRHSRRG